MLRVYLSIGSNIQPETNLPKAVELLKGFGIVRAVSSAWESHAVGAAGQPDYLNACVWLETPLSRGDLKEKLIRPIEAALGRRRTPDKNAPRTIDLDLILVNEEPVNLEKWEYPFVIVPLAELAPDIIHPIARKKIIQVAEEMRSETWMVKRPEILKPAGADLKREGPRTNKDKI